MEKKMYGLSINNFQFFFFKQTTITLNKKEVQRKSGGQEPNPAIIQKMYIEPKEGKQSPTGSNPVIEPNVKQSKTHQTQSSKSNAGPETKLQKRDV
jgi:hypothetical protein